MKRATVVMILGLIAGCSEDARDPIQPPVVVDLCPGCGPTDLAIESAEVRLPTAEQAIRSGDTVTVRVVVRNQGDMAADTATSVSVIMNSPGGGLSGHARVGRIGRDSTRTVDVKVVAPLITFLNQPAQAIMRDFFISVHTNDTFGANNSVRTPQYLYEPNLMRVIGPDSIRAGVASQFTFEVVNRSRYSIPASTISSCMVYFSCRTPPIRFSMPLVAAGTTASVPFTFRVIPDPEIPAMPGGPAVAACFGHPGVSFCAYKSVEFAP